MKLLVALALAAQAAAWTPIASWSGDSTKETETFTATQREWRLKWTVQPSNPALPTRALSVAVYNAKGDKIVSVVNAGPTDNSGESYVRGAGDYYLKITSGNAKWTITAEEPPKK